jgi:hypothetical protein
LQGEKRPSAIIDSIAAHLLRNQILWIFKLKFKYQPDKFCGTPQYKKDFSHG